MPFCHSYLLKPSHAWSNGSCATVTSRLQFASNAQSQKCQLLTCKNLCQPIKCAYQYPVLFSKLLPHISLLPDIGKNIACPSMNYPQPKCKVQHGCKVANSEESLAIQNSRKMTNFMHKFADRC
ncbi:hypothetical protein L596_017668 [Steinernema carpocapsae]|uniref:Uncharacterized protein n=1 Tax=Steinernema carpocapsae TaxID=34508 RepID=A0A4U5N2B8_STECR|nr:hypothetical protein L596_017668 [Steinernema carpocapsae]